MRFATLIASIVGSALLAVAAPTPAAIEARSCNNKASFAIWRVDQSRPDQTGLTGFRVAQTTPNTGREDVLLEFYPPAGSNTCELRMNLPANYDVTAVPNPVQVEFFSADKRLPSGGVSWNTAPGFVSQVGSQRFSTRPTDPTNVYINSFVCSTAMTYRVRIAREVSGAASVTFNNWQGTEFQMSYCK